MSTEKERHDRLEALIKPDAEDLNNYYIGKQAIPKGPKGHEGEPLHKFQDAQRKLGASEVQLNTLGQVRSGEIAGGHTVSAAQRLAEFAVANAKIDRHGNAHIGTLTVSKDAFGEFQREIEAGNTKLIANVEHGIEERGAQTLGKAGVHAAENPVGRKLLESARTDKNGDVHIGNLTVHKADFNQFREAVLSDVNHRNAQLVKESQDPNVERVYKQTVDPHRVPSGEELKTLQAIPDRAYGTLGDRAVHNQTMADKAAHFQAEHDARAPVIVNGVPRDGNVSLSGSVTGVKHEGGITTVSFQAGPSTQTIAFKDMPGQLDTHGQPIRHPLQQLATMHPGDKFGIKIDDTGSNTAYQIESPDGKFRDYRVGPDAAAKYGDPQVARPAQEPAGHHR